MSWRERREERGGEKGAKGTRRGRKTLSRRWRGRGRGEKRLLIREYSPLSPPIFFLSRWGERREVWPRLKTCGKAEKCTCLTSNVLQKIWFSYRRISPLSSPLSLLLTLLSLLVRLINHFILSKFDRHLFKILQLLRSVHRGYSAVSSFKSCNGKLFLLPSFLLPLISSLRMKKSQIGEIHRIQKFVFDFSIKLK